MVMLITPFAMSKNMNTHSMGQDAKDHKDSKG